MVLSYYSLSFIQLLFIQPKLFKGVRGGVLLLANRGE